MNVSSISMALNSVGPAIVGMVESGAALIPAPFSSSGTETSAAM